jgi:hypothetical protein
MGMNQIRAKFGFICRWSRTISRVQTLRIQTLSFPSTPSTLSSSTPSHQHRRAGFLQNSRSFCAIPTALLLISLPLISVRNLARAMLQITALLGSPARCPHWSSWLKPLRFVRIRTVVSISIYEHTQQSASQSDAAQWSQVPRFFGVQKRFRLASAKPFQRHASLRSFLFDQYHA